MIPFQKGSRLLAAALFFFTAHFASAQLAFTNIQILTNREARIRLTVPPATAARIDSSSNLLEWTRFLTVGAGSLVHTDRFDAPRFYRAEQVATTNLLGDHISTSAGDLVIRPVTHASFVMSWNGKTIYNDPDTASYVGIPKADLILVSHDHGDHFDSATITSVRATNGVIVAPQAVFNALSAALRSVTVVLTNGASTNILGVNIEAVPAYNNNHPRGAGNGYVVTLGGKRLYMSGDTGATPEMRALANIDVAFLAMNVPFTMNITDAASAARAFQPRIIYPYHFRNQDGSLANLTAFKTNLLTEPNIEVRIRRWY